MSSEADLVIRVADVGKRYRLRHQYPARYQSLRDTLGDSLRGMASRLAGRPRPERSRQEDFWALRDISFDVRRGERLGIIGRNGAGKSTLLKLLSRVTPPTRGSIGLRGRVGSLLEVGTGFHPELTGRENIFLNGAILGMSRAEIRRKFDEIVAFSEIEQFLDTPVKRFSSGMYIRLAFAVAAHLETEILVVDEVLAVGDAAFQKKCLGKMGDLGQQGRTILFVSHNMPSILRFCDRVLFLHRGALIKDGDTKDVMSLYLNSDTGTPAERVWGSWAEAPGNLQVRLRAVRVHTREGEVTSTFDIRRDIGIDIEYWNRQEGLQLVPNLHFFNEEGTCIFISTNTSDHRWYNAPHPAGVYKATCWIPGNFLAEGLVTVTAAVSTINPTEACAVERHIVSFSVKDQSEGDGARGLIATHFTGVVRPMLDWQMLPGPAAQGEPPC